MSAPLVLSLGSDHAGFPLKRALLAHLAARGIATLDRGAASEESCDYPVHARAVAADLTAGAAAFGVLICSTGIGISIAANKVPGIRAALVHDPETAALSRRHNDANILCLAGRSTSPELAAACLDAFLAAEFEGGRHARRVGLIEPR
jgi:RpiB/LacA/LacB family sugar-phosphate isomerase